MHFQYYNEVILSSRMAALILPEKPVFCCSENCDQAPCGEGIYQPATSRDWTTAPSRHMTEELLIG